MSVEPDLSNAGPVPRRGARRRRARCGCPGWPQHTTQAGDALRDILDAMGADVSLDRSGLTVAGTGEIVGHRRRPARRRRADPGRRRARRARADSPSWIRGVAHIRGHETDRLAALATELNGLGGAVTETEDGLRIAPKPLHGGRFRSYHDHRMATAGRGPRPARAGVDVEDIETTAKTLPDFAGLWPRMLDVRRRSSEPR